MTTMQAAIMIGLASLATQITRWTPFLLFCKRTPELIRYLGALLPSAIWGMLVVYCFKSVTPFVAPFAVPELVATLVVVLLHVWRRNALISIGGGTALYMLLIALL